MSLAHTSQSVEQARSESPTLFADIEATPADLKATPADLEASLSTQRGFSLLSSPDVAVSTVLAVFVCRCMWICMNA